MNKFRVFIFSLILIWASISLAFIVQDIYSGPEKSVNSSPNRLNVTTINLPGYTSNVNVFSILEAMYLFWIFAAILALIFYFKESLRVILNTILSMLGVFIVLGITFIISLLIVFNYPKNSEIIIFSEKNIIGTVPYLIPAIILLIILIYFSMRFVPKSEIKKDNQMEKSIDMVINELKFSDDIKGAIMKAYYDLSKILKNHGIIEENYLTPREFESITLKRLNIDKTPFETIVVLFEEARYSLHPLNEDHRKIAIDSLETIKKMLGD
ncbi:MAG: DUF4129 domain-containing protein [Thermoplasmata archaeon]